MTTDEVEVTTQGTDVSASTTVPAKKQVSTEKRTVGMNAADKLAAAKLAKKKKKRLAHRLRIRRSHANG